MQVIAYFEMGLCNRACLKPLLKHKGDKRGINQRNTDLALGIEHSLTTLTECAALGVRSLAH